MDSIFAINKPIGPTSHDIIDQLRKITGIKKIGHAGTLDPLASGVLVVAIGKEFTKKLGDIVKNEKEYRVTIKLGEKSTTDDFEGEKTKYSFTDIPDVGQVNKVIKLFEGEIEQVPPTFSAIKIKGRAAYKLARKGIPLKLESRKVYIKDIDMVEYKWPYLRLNIISGSGVYIRSIARDIGQALGVGGYVHELIRTRVGKYKIGDSIKIENYK